VLSTAPSEIRTSTATLSPVNAMMARSRSGEMSILPAVWLKERAQGFRGVFVGKDRGLSSVRYVDHQEPGRAANVVVAEVVEQEEGGTLQVLYTMLL
jgi:hypothetical protein